MAGLHSSGFIQYEVCTIWLDYTGGFIKFVQLHSSGFMKFVQYGWITQ